MRFLHWLTHWATMLSLLVFALLLFGIHRLALPLRVEQGLQILAITGFFGGLWGALAYQRIVGRGVAHDSTLTPRQARYRRAIRYQRLHQPHNRHGSH